MRAFTLIELLIVIVIIGILATFAVPQYVASVERTRVGKAKNALALVIRAEKMYMADNDGKYSGSYDITSTCTISSYIEMDEIVNDTDWKYKIASGTATATRSGTGTYKNNTITLDTNGNWGGDHPLK